MSHSLFIMAACGMALSQRLLRGGSSCSAAASASSSSSASASASGAPGGPDTKRDMTTDDWARRWERGQTGWHKAGVNPCLQDFEHLLRARPSQQQAASATAASAASAASAPASRPTIFVPLCGRSVDLRWLHEAGWRVIGLEAVAQPIHDFFREHSDAFPEYTVRRLPCGGYRYADPSGNLQILQCDIFCPSLTRDFFALHCGVSPQGFDAVWDRASLIALPPSTRARYVAATSSWLADQGDYLLTVVEYDQARMNGPPFSVPESTVHELFAPHLPNRRLLRVTDDGRPLPVGDNLPLKEKTFIMNKQ